MTMLRNVILLWLAFAPLFISSCGNGTETGNPSSQNDDDLDGGNEMPNIQDKETLCEESGGDWMSFPDGCADLCEASGVVCASVITDSCNCGDSFCWDGSDCVEEE